MDTWWSHTRQTPRFGGRQEATAKADVGETRRAHGGHKADTWRTNGRQGLEAGPKRIKGHKADTRLGDTSRTRFGGTAKRTQRRTQGGQSAETRPKRNQGGHKVNNGGHMAAKLRGRGQSISRPALILLRENPTVNCLKHHILHTSADQWGMYLNLIEHQHCPTPFKLWEA